MDLECSRKISYLVVVLALVLATGGYPRLCSGSAKATQRYTIQTELYSLTVQVNFLGFVPVRDAKIVVSESISGKIVWESEKELEIPYGFYRLSAEATLELPPDSYVVTVQSLNSEAKDVVLDGNQTISFTQVASSQAVLLLGIVILAVLSFVGFVVIGSRRLKVL